MIQDLDREYFKTSKLKQHFLRDANVNDLWVCLRSGGLLLSLSTIKLTEGREQLTYLNPFILHVRTLEHYGIDIQALDDHLKETVFCESCSLAGFQAFL